MIFQLNIVDLILFRYFMQRVKNRKIIIVDSTIFLLIIYKYSSNIELQEQQWSQQQVQLTEINYQLVNLKPTAYISVMSDKILFLLCKLFFETLWFLFFITDWLILFAVVKTDGNVCDSGGITDVVFFLYFLMTSCTAVLII